jgi:peptidyl-prolyl cis-trans isomerase C
MRQNFKQILHKHRSIVFGLVLILIIVITALWAYLISSNDPVSRFMKSIYPAAIVGGDGISLNEYDTAHESALKFSPQATRHTTMEQLVKAHREEVLLRKLGIVVTSKLVNDEMAYLSSNPTGQFNQVLQKYFNNNQKDFEALVVWPRVLDAQLRIKYNSDSRVNAPDYAKAQSILNEIKNGKKFEDVAKVESSDKVTGQLGGDLGFVKQVEILPELAGKLSSMKAGEVLSQVVVSRLGYHLLLLDGVSEQDGTTLYHLKHILIETNGFEEWLAPQLNTISVWRIK